MRDELQQPQPSGVGPVHGAGEYTRGELAHQDMIYLLCGTRLAPLPLQQGLSLHVPQIAHHREVAHLRSVLKELSLLLAQPYCQVTIGRIVQCAPGLRLDENEYRFENCIWGSIYSIQWLGDQLEVFDPGCAL